MTRFLEGMYTLQFGDANAAADQMGTALRLNQQSGGDPGQAGPRDASVMLGQTDGFDAQATLQDSVSAFKILADVKADRHEAAILESIRLLVPGVSIERVSGIDAQVLENAVQRIESPLVGFALASALEAHVNSLDITGDSKQELFVSQASAAFDKVGEQLRSKRMQDRYPHLVAVVQEAQQRLGSVDTYRHQADESLKRGD